LLFFGESTLKEIEEIYNMIRNRHTEYDMPESQKLLYLEETHELFEKVGFKKTRIFAIHQIDYVDPSRYMPSVDAPPSFWRISLPPELVEMARKEIKEEMIKTKTGKGFKMTYYNIIAYAQKL
jgi:hypothetical protein